MNLADQKTALRKRLAAARECVDGDTRARASAALQMALSPYLEMALSPYLGRVIAGYMPIGSEADPLPALGIASQNGLSALPVVVKKAAPLVFHRWKPGEPLERGAFGVMVPTANDVIQPDIIIVPLLGFSEHGARIGYGGGFYDRTIAELRAKSSVICIGFGFEVQRAEIPTEPTDQALDMIVTERGVVLEAGSHPACT